MVVVLSLKNNNKQIGCLTVKTRGSTTAREMAKDKKGERSLTSSGYIGQWIS